MLTPTYRGDSATIDLVLALRFIVELHLVELELVLVFAPAGAAINTHVFVLFSSN